eukprot:502749_1
MNKNHGDKGDLICCSGICCIVISVMNLPDAYKSDGNWHDCYVYNCENDGFTFEHPDSIKERYTILLIIGGILLTISCIWCAQVVIDYKAVCKGFCEQNDTVDTKKETKHHRIPSSIQ